MKVLVTQSAIIEADTYGEAQNIFNVYWRNGGKVGQPERVTLPSMSFSGHIEDRPDNGAMISPMSWSQIKEAMAEMEIQDDEVIRMLMGDPEDPDNVLIGYIRGVEVMETVNDFPVAPGDRVTFNNSGRQS